MPFRSGIPFTFFLTLKKPNNDVNASQAAIVTGAEKNMKQLQTDSVELQNKITKLRGELSRKTNEKYWKLSDPVRRSNVFGKTADLL